jgi:hypothetical protein
MTYLCVLNLRAGFENIQITKWSKDNSIYISDKFRALFRSRFYEACYRITTRYVEDAKENPQNYFPTGPESYRSRKRHRPESNYGRLVYDYEYVQDGEYQLHTEKHRRDDEGRKDEPRVVFKGRGAMK